MTQQSSVFVRTRFTWLAYLMLAYYAYLQASLGPLMPFLRAELNLSYTVAGLHVSAFALGMVLAGLSGDSLAHRFGRYVLFWGGAAGMAVGGIGLALGNTVVFTLAGILVMGWLGSFVLVMIQAMLSDRYQGQRTIALTEANVAASIFAGMSPLLVGGFQRIGVGWQGALYFGAAALVALAIVFWREPLPESARKTESEALPQKLPATFWAYWVVIFLAVSVEWCTMFWGADFLENEVGLARVNAATMMSIFFCAMVLGRFLGSRLSRRFAGGRLLIGALAITIIGFPLFWLAPIAALNIAGLFVCGLGIANLFPLTLSVAVGVAANQPDRASARVSMAGGLAILIAPLVLGWVADYTGIFWAYGLEGVLLAVALVMALLANRLASVSPVAAPSLPLGVPTPRRD